MFDLVAQLDAFLADQGEDVILRRETDGAPIDVACKARVDALSTAQVAAGITATELNVVLSPTPITAAGWPGTSTPAAPFNVDQRIPVMGGADKILMRGAAPRTITFVDAKIIGGKLVRINLRVTGPS